MILNDFKALWQELFLIFTFNVFTEVDFDKKLENNWLLLL